MCNLYIRITIIIIVIFCYRDEKIRHKIVRIFNIWEERGIYDAKFIAELGEIIENVGTVNATENEIVLSSFQVRLSGQMFIMDISIYLYMSVYR